MMNTSLLRTEKLVAGYRGLRVLEPLDFSLHAGERLALVGPNGCGKSTLLKAIVGMADIQDGALEFQGHALGRMSTVRRIRQGISYLMQDRNIFPGLTVRENLEMARAGDGPDFDLRLKKLLDHLSALAPKMDTRAGLLSGGERQALALAMVLARRGSLLLLDEPVAGLSQKAADSILRAVSALQADEGFALIIVEHNLKLIHPWVNRAVIMVRGKIAEDTADTSILLDRARLERHYLG